MVVNDLYSAAAGGDPTDGAPPADAGTADEENLFAAFVACRTTLDDLSGRTAALGEDVRGSVIAAHLTGRSPISDSEYNAVAEAINGRLYELSLPAAAPYRLSGAASHDSTHGLGRRAGGPA